VRHLERLQPDWFALLGGVIDLACAKRGDLLDLSAPLLVVQEVGQRRRLVRRAGVAIGLPHDRESIDVAHGRGPKEHGVDHAEDGRVRADAERKRQQGDECERRIPGEEAESVAKVLAQHGGSLVLVF
jgi:hypothetical protein